MKIEVELLDAFLISREDGTSTDARVATVRYQERPRAAWRKVSLVVESPNVANVMAAVAAYFKALEQA